MRPDGLAGSDLATRVRLPDGAELSVTAEGAGPAILLVSGLGGSAAFWSDIAARLARDFRIVRFDQRGIGASSRGVTPCTIATLAADCLVVADALGLDRFTFVGHSTGGCIGQAFAGLAPERLAGLVLSGAWLKPSRYMTALFGARQAMLDNDPPLYAATGALLGYAPAWLEANWSAYEAAIIAPPPSEAARRVIGERIRALLAFDGSAEARSIAAPTLVLGARDDVIVPAFLQEDLAAALPDATLTFSEDGGHFFPLTRMDAFVQSLRTFADAAPR